MSSLAISGSTPAPVDTERQVSVLKKAQNVEKSQAEALVDLIKQAPQPGQVGSLVNVLA